MCLPIYNIRFFLEMKENVRKQEETNHLWCLTISLNRFLIKQKVDGGILQFHLFTVLLKCCYQELVLIHFEMLLIPILHFNEQKHLLCVWIHATKRSNEKEWCIYTYLTPDSKFDMNNTIFSNCISFWSLSLITQYTIWSHNALINLHVYTQTQEETVIRSFSQIESKNNFFLFTAKKAA